MTQAPAAVFKIPTESPQLARGRVGRARKAVGAQPKAPRRVVRIGTRAATRGDGVAAVADPFGIGERHAAVGKVNLVTVH